MDQELSYAGEPSGYEDVLRRADELGVELRVLDRQRSRGAGDVVLALVAAGAAEAVKQLVAEFATSMRTRARRATVHRATGEEPS